MKKRHLLIAGLLLLCHSSRAQDGMGDLKKVTTSGQEVLLTTTSGEVSLRVFPDSILSIAYYPGNSRPEQVSNAVLTEGSGSLTELPRSAGDNHQDFSYGSFRISVTVSPVRVSISQNSQEVLTLLGYKAGDGYQSLSLGLKKDEALYGTGSRAIPLNRKGYRVNLNNNPWYAYSKDADNLNFSIPFYMSSRGYAVFFDNPSIGYMDLGKTNPEVVELGAKSGQAVVYLMTGTPSRILEKFTGLVGRAPLPPRWALGNFVSRYGYRSQQEVLEVVEKMEKAGYPMDAVVIDLFWFGDGEMGKWKMGDLDWNRTRFPDPEGMLKKLNSKSLVPILVTEPFVLQESKNFKYTMDNGLHASAKNGDTVTIKEFYFGYAGLLDIFKKQSQDWFWQQYDKEIKRGVGAWWGDLGEPEKHPDYLWHDLSAMGFSRKFNATEVHNIYGHYWSKLLYDGYKTNYPETRLFFLNRSGYAGTWRYGSFPWSGDVDRTWDGFRAQLPVLQSMALCGVPYMHSDAGGFAMGTRDPELYTRWLQFAVFTPIFRPHGSVTDPNPNIPSIQSEPVFYDEKTQAIVKKYMQWRYELMPYVYSLSYEATTRGMPLIRPMMMQFPGNVTAASYTDQYMFGDAILVAPVTEQKATVRKVHLPQGKWYDWHQELVYEGAQTIFVPVTLENIPLFVKGGSFIPRKPFFRNTSRYPNDSLYVHYYPGANGKYQWYEDDGKDPEAFAKAKHELTTFSSEESADKTILRVVSNKGMYAGRPSSMYVEFIIHLPTIQGKLMINGKSVTINRGITKSYGRSGIPAGPHLDMESGNLHIPLTWNHDDLVIEITK